MFERDKIQEAIERLKKVTGKSMALPSVLDIAHAFMGNDSWTMPYLRDALVELLETARDSIPLPKDADGETIHVGDVMANSLGYKFEAWGVGYGGSDGNVGIVFCNEPDGYGCYIAEGCHHYKPTVEDMLREFADKITDLLTSGTESLYEETIAEYVEKIRALQDA